MEMVERKHFAVGVVLEGRKGNQRKIVEWDGSSLDLFYVSRKTSADEWRTTKGKCFYGTLCEWAARIVPAADAEPGLAEQSIAVLREVEWSSPEPGNGTANCCPICSGFRSEGHDSRCTLALALARAEREGVK